MWANLHLSYFLTWERPPGCLIWHLPQVFVCHLTKLFSSCRYNSSWANIHFSLRTLYGGGAFQSIWGCHDICLILGCFHTASITQSELSSLTSFKAWGDLEMFKNEFAFLLILTGGCTEGDRVFGLSTMWIYPYQARAPSMEEAVKELTLLPSTGSDCPYALVWLKGDTHHVPLPREGHLSILMVGAPAVLPAEGSINYRSSNSSAWVPR